MRRRRVARRNCPESPWVLNSAARPRPQRRIRDRGLVAGSHWLPSCLVLQHRSFGLQRHHFATRRHARRGTSRVQRDIPGALQSRGALIRDLRRPCVLLVRCKAKRRRGARAHANSASFFVPVGLREAAAMASRLTPSTQRPPAQKKTGTTLRPATPSSSK